LSALGGPAFAQSGSAQAGPAEAGVEEIVVTGSRIVRNGFQAPTPVTTLASDALQNRAPSNIPDALNQLPQFRGSQSNNQSVTWNANSPATGNYLNLRGLGTQRSLILLDGVRVPPTSFSGGVDTNTLPQALVERVDVVTGGASAAYGSDAVVGVVNFILDKNFTGIKGSIQGGTSTYGDDNSYKGMLAAGTSFAGGRGHVEGSLEHYRSMGLMQRDRPLGRQGILVVGAGTAANPNITLWDVNFANTTFGGLINSGPLAGYEFVPGGDIRRMDPGQSIPRNPNYMVGGGGGSYDTSHGLAPSLRTDQAFGRVSYDLAPNVNVHAQLALAETRTRMNIHPDERFAGTATGVVIFRDNPFLLPSVVQRLGATESFQFSRISERDIPPYFNTVTANSINANVGADGTFSVAGKEFNWDANYVRGVNYLRSKINEFNSQRFYAAVDAARDPAGNIVCRANLIAPGSYPGCVPMNLFGVGAPSQAAIDYAMGVSQYQVVNRMSIAAVNLSGDLFNLPAGPLSIAIGGEMRKQDLDQESNASPGDAPSVSYANIRGVPPGVLISNFTNVGTAEGSVKVKEAYAETVVPILRDAPFARSLEINGAARITDYSTSGTVVTWKVGLNYAPFDDLRIRATQSRDIAAPSLYQLYQGGTVATNIMADPHTGIQRAWTTVTQGNPNLTPEKGTMTVFGAVYSPSWLPGFTMSADYYGLLITDAIGALGSVQVVQDCEDSGGTAPICANVIRPFPFSNRTPDNFPLTIYTGAFNQAKIFQSGIDVEMAYRFPMSTFFDSWSGTLELRGLLSIGLENETKSSARNPTVSNMGAGQNAKYRGQIEGTYVNGPLTIRLAHRATGHARRSVTQIYADQYDQNPNRWYTDMNINYKLDGLRFVDAVTGGSGTSKELFLTVQNLFNTQPPIVADCCSPKLQIATSKALYDTVGRYYTIGLRFRR
jgi:outer membrane receptor protein involved in Fe transport